MKNRNYNQFCSLAKALDILGERWSLLIIRDLIGGPKRYKDLNDGLQSMGTNLLAKRLKELAEHQIIEKIKLPPPISCEAYQLTEIGRQLEPTLIQLANWGLRFMPRKKTKKEFWSPNWNPIAMKARFKEHKANNLNFAYGLEIDGFQQSILISDGDLEINNQIPIQSDGELRCRGIDFLKLIQGDLELENFLKLQNTLLKGPQKKLVKLLSLFN